MSLLDTHDERGRLAAELAHVASSLASAGHTADTVLTLHAAALPARTRTRLAELTRPPRSGVGYRVVEGLFAAVGDPGPTATHWRAVDRVRTATFDIALTLVAALHGEVVGWHNQQDGHLVHNILPSPAHERMQVGGSSLAPLTWHTEDAFHPDRADFLLLACVRNPDGLGTRLAVAGSFDLTDEQIAELSQPKLVIYPDDSYQDSGADSISSAGMATVWQRSGHLCLRYDPAYTRMLAPDDGFRSAYEHLGRQMNEKGVLVSLRPGDLLIVDNDVAAHGRGPFRARYDGTDRWLKRVLVRAPRRRPAAEQGEHGFGQLQIKTAAPTAEKE